MSTCNNGHANSPGDSFCGICGGAISSGTDAVNVGSPISSGEIATHQTSLDEFVPKKSNKAPIILVAIAVLLGAGFLISKAKPATHDVTFTLKVYDEVGCDLGWGYSNVLGMDIDLDIDGESYDSSSLPSYGYSGSLDECVLSTTFYGVPEGHGNYSFDSIRGTMEYSESEMSANDWEVNVALGLD